MCIVLVREEKTPDLQPPNLETRDVCVCGGGVGGGEEGWGIPSVFLFHKNPNSQHGETKQVCLSQRRAWLTPLPQSLLVHLISFSNSGHGSLKHHHGSISKEKTSPLSVFGNTN